MTAPAAFRMVPQLPAPMPVVKLSRVGPAPGKPQQEAVVEVAVQVALQEVVRRRIAELHLHARDALGDVDQPGPERGRGRLRGEEQAEREHHLTVAQCDTGMLGPFSAVRAHATSST